MTIRLINKKNMRRFDKLANIKKSFNVLLEKRIIEEKSLLKEDWKTNVAKLASIGGVVEQMSN
jgi:hypothetical protein